MNETLLAVVKAPAIEDRQQAIIDVQAIAAAAAWNSNCIVTLVNPSFEVVLNEIKTGQYGSLCILDERTFVDNADEAAQLVRAMRKSMTGLVTGNDGKRGIVHTDPVVIKWAMEKSGRYADEFPARLAANIKARAGK